MNIAVYITSYNQKNYLIQAIESVLAQTLRPSQIIVVDDASSDGSQEVIRGYASRYPDLFAPLFHERNLGVATTRVHALESVCGDFVTFLDGDDRFMPEKLEHEAQAITANPSAQFAFSDYQYVDADLGHLAFWSEFEKPPQGRIFKETLARTFPGRTLFRSELVHYRSWREVGFHRPDLNLYEDYEMRIRLTSRLDAVYVDRPLSQLRLHGKGLSSQPIEEHLATLDRVLAGVSPLIEELSPEDHDFVIDGLTRFRCRLALKELSNGVDNTLAPVTSGQIVSHLKHYGRECGCRGTLAGLSRLLLTPMAYRAVRGIYGRFKTRAE